jgi:hypothetical protein
LPAVSAPRPGTSVKVVADAVRAVWISVAALAIRRSSWRTSSSRSAASARRRLGGGVTGPYAAQEFRSVIGAQVAPGTAGNQVGEHHMEAVDGLGAPAARRGAERGGNTAPSNTPDTPPTSASPAPPNAAPAAAATKLRPRTVEPGYPVEPNCPSPGGIDHRAGRRRPNHRRRRRVERDPLRRQPRPAQYPHTIDEEAHRDPTCRPPTGGISNLDQVAMAQVYWAEGLRDGRLRDAFP